MNNLSEQNSYMCRGLTVHSIHFIYTQTQYYNCICVTICICISLHIYIYIYIYIYNLQQHYFFLSLDASFIIIFKYC